MSRTGVSSALKIIFERSSPEGPEVLHSPADLRGPGEDCQIASVISLDWLSPTVILENNLYSYVQGVRDRRHSILSESWDQSGLHTSLQCGAFPGVTLVPHRQAARLQHLDS